MTDHIRTPRQCAWHMPDGSACTAQTVLELEGFRIPVCRSHRRACYAALTREVERYAIEEHDSLEERRQEIADEAIREHCERDGCEVLAYIAQQEAAKPASFVYYMRCGDYVKIGRSFDPVKRAREIRYGSSQAPAGMDRSLIALERVEKGDSQDELARHERFAHLRVTGEWFASAPELEELMAGLDRPDVYFGADV